MSKKTSVGSVLFRRTVQAVLLIVVLAASLLNSGFSSKFGGTLKVEAAASDTINFQARLLVSSGVVVPDGYYHAEFKLYNASTSSGSSQGSCSGDANCLWVENYTGASTGARVRVVNGYLTVNLGTNVAFGGSIDWSRQLWMTMNIGGSSTSATWDGEMNPRLKLTAVPYAFQAGSLSLRGRRGRQHGARLPRALAGAGRRAPRLRRAARNGRGRRRSSGRDRQLQTRVEPGPAGRRRRRLRERLRPGSEQ